MKYQIIKAAPNFLIVNKPAGLLTHGAPHINEPSLVDELVRDYPEIKTTGDDPIRPGLVHRLDKLASGLLVVARNNESFTDLKKQFQARQIKKYYTALVYGQIEKDEDEIDFPIKRSAKGNKMAALPKTNKGEKTTAGRNAITKFWAAKRFINYTLLKVRIKTGRTHQIRCHLSAYGHPLVGDDLYATKKTKAKNKKLGLKRIFLIAHQLEFKDLDGEKQSFQIELPEELKTFLKQVK